MTKTDVLKSSLLQRCAAALALAVLGGCGGAGDEALRPALVAGRLSAELHGSWRVLGEGSYMVVDAAGVHVYHEGRSLCQAEPQPWPPQELSDYKLRRLGGAGPIRLELYQLPEQPSTYSLERVKAIPAACARPLPATPARTFQALWEFMDLDYAFFAERRIDWPARKAALAPQAEQAGNALALQDVLTRALAGFDDEHVSLSQFNAEGQDQPEYRATETGIERQLRQAFAAQQGVQDYDDFVEAWEARLRAAQQQRLQSGGPVLNGAMVWGLLPGNVGYLEIRGFGGFLAAADASAVANLAAARAELDRALTALAGTRALIVDVSLNRGGLDGLAAEIAGHFSDQRRLGFTKTPRRDPGRAQSWWVEPRGGARYLKPVYLLTSERTVSAAETFTLMMKAQPQVVHAGTSTSGALSNTLSKPLPGGWQLTLSNERYLDANGQSFEVRGVPPQLTLPLFDPTTPDALEQGHGRSISALLAHIAARP